MNKRHARAVKRQPPYYWARKAESVEALEALLNELRDKGFTIREILGGGFGSAYTVVALMPDR